MNLAVYALTCGHLTGDLGYLMEGGEGRIRLPIPSYLIEDADDIDPSWLPAGGRVALTAGASTPEVLVALAITRLRSLGVTAVVTAPGVEETTTFKLPADLDRQAVR